MARGGGRQAAPAPGPDGPEPAPLLSGLSGIGLLPTPQQVHFGTSASGSWSLGLSAPQDSLGTDFAGRSVMAGLSGKLSMPSERCTWAVCF